MSSIRFVVRGPETAIRELHVSMLKEAWPDALDVSDPEPDVTLPIIPSNEVRFDPSDAVWCFAINIASAATVALTSAAQKRVKNWLASRGTGLDVSEECH